MLRFLFSFKGRANRAQFWAFYLGCMVVMLGVIFAFYILYSAAIQMPQTGTLWFGNPGTIAVLTGFSIVYVLFFYVMLAVVVKRLHDRGKSAWWLALFYGVPLAAMLAELVLSRMAQNSFPGQIVLMLVFFFAAWLIMLWYIIEILFLPGTKGDNRFGPKTAGISGRIDRPDGAA